MTGRVRDRTSATRSPAMLVARWPTACRRMACGDIDSRAAENDLRVSANLLLTLKKHVKGRVGGLPVPMASQLVQPHKRIRSSARATQRPRDVVRRRGGRDAPETFSGEGPRWQLAMRNTLSEIQEGAGTGFISEVRTTQDGRRQGARNDERLGGRSQEDSRCRRGDTARDETRR